VYVDELYYSFSKFGVTNTLDERKWISVILIRLSWLRIGTSIKPVLAGTFIKRKPVETEKNLQKVLMTTRENSAYDTFCIISLYLHVLPLYCGDSLAYVELGKLFSLPVVEFLLAFVQYVMSLKRACKTLTLREKIQACNLGTLYKKENCQDGNTFKEPLCSFIDRIYFCFAH
ncbi:hypothetical protein L9F63_003068, partial [Diploptera punctata]